MGLGSGTRVCSATLVALSLGACHQYLDPRLYRQLRPDLPGETAGELLQVRALGVQGFVVRHGGVAVLFPPLHSNPPLHRVVAGNRPLGVRPEQVDANHSPAWLERVSAVLVGHSHYDHLMDVPYLAQKHLPRDAVLYGSRTAGYLLASFRLENRIVPVNGWKPGEPDWVDYRSCTKPPPEGCVRGSGMGDWLPGTVASLRVRALCSRHSSQLLGLPVSSQGCQESLPEHPPRTADEWKLGDTLAYLVEFLDARGDTAFRVYYQDSPTDPEYGHVPDALLPASGGVAHGVDVAILCGGAWDQVRDNPRGIIRNTNPRFVLVGHWENFFREPSKPLQTLFSIDVGRLRDRLDALRAAPDGWHGQYWFAVPGSLYVFPRAWPS